MADYRKAVAKARLEEEVVELMIKSQVTNVYMEDGETTLSAKLAEMIEDISEKTDYDTVDAKIKAAIDALIDDAPETYDTLKEIAEYIAQDKSAMQALNAAIGDKVDKVEGKGLSTNDFTDELKTKLENITDHQNAFGKAQVGEDLIESTEMSDTIKFVAGDNVTLTADTTNKAVKIDVSAHVSVDAELSDTSENAVQNKVIKAAIDSKPNFGEDELGIYLEIL